MKDVFIAGVKEKYPKEARLSSLKSEVEKAENEVQNLNSQH